MFNRRKFGQVLSLDQQLSIPGQQQLRQESYLPRQGVNKEQQPYGYRVVYNAQFNQARFEVTNNRSFLIFEDAINREYFLLQNKSINPVFLTFGQKATDQIGLEIAAGGTYEPPVAPVDAIYCIGDIAAAQVIIAIQGLV